MGADRGVERVVAVAADQRVGALVADEHIVATKPVDRVVVGSTNERVVAGCPVDRAAAAAIDDCDICRGKRRRALQRGDELRRGAAIAVGVVPEISSGLVVDDAVARVMGGSGAEKAGLRIGDRIVAIDGKPVAERFGEQSALRSWSRIEDARHDFADDFPFLGNVDLDAAPHHERINHRRTMNDVRVGQIELAAAHEREDPAARVVARRAPDFSAVEDRPDLIRIARRRCRKTKSERADDNRAADDDQQQRPEIEDREAQPSGRVREQRSTDHAEDHAKDALGRTRDLRQADQQDDRRPESQKGVCAQQRKIVGGPQHSKIAKKTPRMSFVAGSGSG